MLTLILIDVQYLQNVVFSFEKVLNSHNHSSSDSHHPMKKYPIFSLGGGNLRRSDCDYSKLFQS